MALDRTSWYNYLVDDDGSNTVGTVWGKDDVDALMTLIDNELLRLNRGVIPFTPTVREGSGGFISVGSTQCYSCQMGPVVFFRLLILNIGLVNPVGSLGISMPFPPNAEGLDRTLCQWNIGGVQENGVLIASSSGNRWDGYRNVGTFPAGPVAVHCVAQGFYLRA